MLLGWIVNLAFGSFRLRVADQRGQGQWLWAGREDLEGEILVLRHERPKKIKNRKRILLCSTSLFAWP